MNYSKAQLEMMSEISGRLACAGLTSADLFASEVAVFFLDDAMQAADGGALDQKAITKVAADNLPNEVEGLLEDATASLPEIIDAYFKSGFLEG